MLENTLPLEGIVLKNDLVNSGLVMDVDFKWSYYSPIPGDSFDSQFLEPKKVVFYFRDPAMATFYELKWK